MEGRGKCRLLMHAVVVEGGLQHDWVSHRLRGCIEMNPEAKPFTVRPADPRLSLSLSNAPVPQSLMSQVAHKE
jgi:hypothetical protein